MPSPCHDGWAKLAHCHAAAAHVSTPLRSSSRPHPRPRAKGIATLIIVTACCCQHFTSDPGFGPAALLVHAHTYVCALLPPPPCGRARTCGTAAPSGRAEASVCTCCKWWCLQGGQAGCISIWGAPLRPPPASLCSSGHSQLPVRPQQAMLLGCAAAAPVVGSLTTRRCKAVRRSSWVCAAARTARSTVGPCAPQCPRAHRASCSAPL